MAVLEMRGNLCEQTVGLRHDAPLDVRRQVFVREIHRGFEMGKYAGQPTTPAPIKVAEGPGQLTQGLASLCLGLGSNKIGDRFSLNQVELAVEKGAAGKFPRLGEAQPQTPEYPHDCGKYGTAAMQMELGDILPGYTPRRREPKQETVVELLSGRGVSKTRAPCNTRRGQLSR